MLNSGFIYIGEYSKKRGFMILSDEVSEGLPYELRFSDYKTQ